MYTCEDCCGIELIGYKNLKAVLTKSFLFWSVLTYWYVFFLVNMFSLIVAMISWFLFVLFQTDSTTSNPVPHLPPNAHIPDKWKNMSLPHGLFPPKNGNPFEGKITKVPLKSHSTKGSKPNHEMTTAMPRPTKTSPPHPRPTPPYHIPVTTAAPHPTMSIHAHERSTTVRPTRTTG